MYAVAANPIDRNASRGTDHSHVFADQLIDQLADDLVTLNAEGAATIERLGQLGWAAAFVQANHDEASRRANARFVRQVDADPSPSLSTVQTAMADIIASMMPPTQLIVANLQARGFTTRHIDMLLPKARARAALGFAHGTSGMTN